MLPKARYTVPKRTNKRIINEQKRHTLQMRLIVERNSLHIIDVQEAKGSEYYFKVYKDTIGNEITSSVPVAADLGYQGIAAYHANSCIRIKSNKNHQLTRREKAYNQRLARRRIVIEHINGRIQTFRCMAYPYRGIITTSIL